MLRRAPARGGPWTAANGVWHGSGTYGAIDAVSDGTKDRGRFGDHPGSWKIVTTEARQQTQIDETLGRRRLLMLALATIGFAVNFWVGTAVAPGTEVQGFL